MTETPVIIIQWVRDGVACVCVRVFENVTAFVCQRCVNLNNICVNIERPRPPPGGHPSTNNTDTSEK